MKFIVDAQLPRRIARELAASGQHDAVHTLDLPAGNHTSDGDIIASAIRESRIVVTKDRDFVT
jgi:predicted nuclease of predicted toxin-antitoxin system